jgi:hypothetical protein
MSSDGPLYSTGTERSVANSGSLATEIHSPTAAASDSNFQPMFLLRTSITAG